MKIILIKTELKGRWVSTLKNHTLNTDVPPLRDGG